MGYCIAFRTPALGAPSATAAQTMGPVSHDIGVVRVPKGAAIVIEFVAADPKTFKIGENPKKIRL